MKNTITFVLLAATVMVSAQTIERPKVYLNQNDEIATAFAAGVAKKQVPVMLVTDEAEARYVVSFAHERNDGSKARGITTAIFTGVYQDGSSERISMMVADTKTKEIVFSYTCMKDRGRVQSAAECLAKHWKKHLTK